MVNEIKALNKEGLWTRDFILITLITLFSFLSFQMLLPTLPVYATKLGGSDTHAGLVIGIFTFSAVLIRPFAGYALDAYGRKGLFIIGLLIFG
ncbi:MAG: MFS transporter, partial [Syntrophomonadaceae bacterium]|nr:MFS transporter [Syntrophomonadaceae bacterium]